MKPRFITLEGGEGAGKSTQIHRLAARLGAAGVAVEVTREPGGTPLAEAVRTLLLDHAIAPRSPLAEAMLFAAARADHVAHRIRPALAAGQWVLCDRFTDSTHAYQGAADGIPDETLTALDRVVLDGLQPDLTILLDLPATEGLARARQRANERTGGKGAQTTDHFEARDLAFHERLRAGFLQLAKGAPDRIAVFDAMQSATAIEADIWTTLCNRFGPVDGAKS